VPKVVAIEVDAEVFEFLQKNAAPLVDTPNDVLRRLLLREKPKEGPTMVASAQAIHATPGTNVNVDAFVGEFVKREFGAGFTRRGRYRLMFESPEHLVYVQNFSKRSDHLWYRITENPWRELQTSKKTTWLCFTNPVERYAYVIPVNDVIKRCSTQTWSRNYLEVNIDAVASRWVELDWKIEGYLKQY
jgi:hypothetical protein